jgi:hypothetical protein
MTLLRDMMVADLERGLEIVRDGHEVVPTWRVVRPGHDTISNKARGAPSPGGAFDLGELCGSRDS